MFNVSSLKTRIDDLRRDTTSGTIDSNDIIGSINGVIDDLRSDIDLSTAVKNKYFYYLSDRPDYSVTNVLGITDFSNVKDLRVAFGDAEDFEAVTPNDFARYTSNAPGTVWTTKNVYAIETKAGDEILRVIYQSPLSKTELHLANDYDANGTWTADTSGSDAYQVATDPSEYILNGGAVRFNVDVSQSVNNYAQIYNSGMTPVDISSDALYLRGRIRMWVHIGTPTYVTSFTLRWGSDSSDYYTVTVTAPANGGSFQAGWNELEFAWENATTTGVPDDSVMNYILFRVTYSASQADDYNYRISDIVMYEPKRLDLYYYSKHWVDNGSGTTQEYVTSLTGAERILAPGGYLELFALGTAADIFDQQGDTAQDALRYRARYNSMKDRFKMEVGTRKLRKQGMRNRIYSPWPTI